MAVATPPKPPPKRSAEPSNGPVPAVRSGARFERRQSDGKSGQRIVIYGPGGVGKSTLAASAPNPTFYDLDRTADHLGVNYIDGVACWQDLLDALREDSLHPDNGTTVVDSATVAQEWAIAHTLANVRIDKGDAVSSIEGYGYGKGYQFVYETFLKLLQALDAHCRRGRDVILVCHCIEDMAPNPNGDDYLRYAPALQQPPKTGRIRDRVIAWADHVLFLCFDVNVNRKGIAEGGSTRTIFPNPMATHIAKSRSLDVSLPYEKDSTELWTKLQEARHATR